MPCTCASEYFYCFKFSCLLLLCIDWAYIYGGQLQTTFSCLVYEDCILSSIHRSVYPEYFIQRIDGRVIRVTDKSTHSFPNYTFQEIKFSDAGIYYFVLLNRIHAEVAFIVQVRDYPTQPVISAQNLSSISDQGMLELICSSKSRTQPVFSRSLLSYHWKVNQLNTKDPYTCFGSKGSRLTLCPESCRLKSNSSISVTCTVEEDGLMSNESEPFIIRRVTPLVPVEQLVSMTQVSVSAEYKGGHNTGALIGACLGCLVAGSVLSIYLALLFIRGSILKENKYFYCKQEPRSYHHYDLTSTELVLSDGEGERNSGDRNESFYITSAVDNGLKTCETEITRQYEVLDHNKMENQNSQYSVILSSGNSGDRNEAFYINSVVNSGVRTSETEITRQYEVLDQNRMENQNSQYSVILSSGSGRTNEAEID